MPKKPKADAGFGAPEKKSRRVSGVPRVEERQPVWRLSALDLDGPFGWRRMDPSLLDAVRDRLRSFESMSWDEILGKRHHEIEVGALSAAAQRRLAELRVECDAVVSFALDGARRVIGIREGSVCHLLWWDPEHLVCPSTLKHT